MFHDERDKFEGCIIIFSKYYMSQKIGEGVARIEEGMCRGFFCQRQNWKLLLRLDLQWASKVVLFQNTFAYANLINVWISQVVKLSFVG